MWALDFFSPGILRCQSEKIERSRLRSSVVFLPGDPVGDVGFHQGGIFIEAMSDLGGKS